MHEVNRRITYKELQFVEKGTLTMHGHAYICGTSREMVWSSILSDGAYASLLNSREDPPQLASRQAGDTMSVISVA